MIIESIITVTREGKDTKVGIAGSVNAYDPGARGLFASVDGDPFELTEIEEWRAGQILRDEYSKCRETNFHYPSEVMFCIFMQEYGSENWRPGESFEDFRDAEIQLDRNISQNDSRKYALVKKFTSFTEWETK